MGMGLEYDCGVVVCRFADAGSHDGDGLRFYARNRTHWGYVPTYRETVMTTLFRAFALLFVLAVSGAVIAQTQPLDTVGSIQKNIHKLDILNQILPVLMTKDQLKEVILEVEKVRAAAKLVEGEEKKELMALEGRVNKAVKDSIEKGDLPEDKLMTELSDLYKKFVSRRKVQMAKNVAAMYEALKKRLNEGQMKAIANSLNPKIFNPDADLEKMSEMEKTVIWIEYVLLDPVAYEVLLDLSKK